jgi:dephospho-CoA kinase
MMKTVAITGGIGSGKTEVCEFLATRGIPVYDSDSAAKRLYDADDTLLDAIEEAFGCGIRLQNGRVDREKLASIVFPSPEKLAILEDIIHPAVLQDFRRWKAMNETMFGNEGPSAVFFGKSPFVVIESAIILNKPAFLRETDRVLLVDAPLAVRLERASFRDGKDKETVIRRMDRQRFDLSKVDAVIHNAGSLADLHSEIENVFRRLHFNNS